MPRRHKQTADGPAGPGRRFSRRKGAGNTRPGENSGDDD